MFYRQVMDQGFIKETPLWELSVFGFSVIALSKKILHSPAAHQ